MSIYVEARQAIKEALARKGRDPNADALDDAGVAVVLTMLVRVAENIETMTNVAVRAAGETRRLADAMESLAKAIPPELGMEIEDPDQPHLFGGPCGHDHG
jgi:hypothetical protein